MAHDRALILLLAALTATASAKEELDAKHPFNLRFQSPPACDLCERGDVQGPEASGLYQFDFHGFCTKCKEKKMERKQEVKDGSTLIKKENAEVRETNKSPSACELCKRSDTQGPAAGALYNDDFAVFCASCPGASETTL